jgi:transcriptional regulator with XRE-family HTH domain
MPKMPTRKQAPAPLDPGADFGQRLRALRKSRVLTLDDVSAASGLSRAAVSKIERGEMSPTYESLLKLARGLGTDVSLLISGRQPAGGGFDVTRAGEGAAHRADKRFPSRLLAPALPHRTLHAFVTEVRWVPIEQYGPWDSHHSEDLLFVLEGTIAVHLADRPVVQLSAGDSMQMDGRIPHALVAVPPAGTKRTKHMAQLLWVSVPFS